MARYPTRIVKVPKIEGGTNKLLSRDRDHCLARDSKCRKCNKRGHFQVMCRSAKVGSIQGNPNVSEKPHDVFLEVLQIKKYIKKDPDQWNVPLRIEGRPVSLHVDTGAAVTVITEQTWKAIGQPLYGCNSKGAAANRMVCRHGGGPQTRRKSTDLCGPH